MRRAVPVLLVLFSVLGCRTAVVTSEKTVAVPRMAPSQRTIVISPIWTDGFENHLTTGGVNNNPWDTQGCDANNVNNIFPDGCNPSISTDIAHGGTHSLKSQYSYTCGMTDGYSGCGTYINLFHAQTSEVYMRWWTHFPNAPIDQVFNQIAGSKQMYNKTNEPTTALVFWHVFQGQNTISFQATHNAWTTYCAPQGGQGYPGGDSGCNFYPNVGTPIALNDGQWHCVETRIKANTPGQLNGIGQVWIDGVQTVNYTAVGIIPPGSSAGFTEITHYAQLGNGARYIDDFAVSPTRIGCGAVSPPSTLPTPPTSLQVS
jgi:hypothetical protein